MRGLLFVLMVLWVCVAGLWICCVDMSGMNVVLLLRWGKIVGNCLGVCLFCFIIYVVFGCLEFWA